VLHLGFDTSQQEGTQDLVQLADDLLLLLIGLSFALEPGIEVFA